MRAVAVALVVLYHAGLPVLTGGYVGVDVFFVISGFVITNLLLGELRSSGTVSILGFYGRRAQRIIPLSAVVIVATVLASYSQLGFLRGAHIAVDGNWAAAFAANIHFAAEGTDYLGSQLAPSPLQHYWSLSVEEQFYFVWPLLLGALFRLGGRGRPEQGRQRRQLLPVVAGAGAIMAASYVWSIVETGDNSVWAYFSTLTRACELMAGALVAVAAPWLARLHHRFTEPMTVLGLGLIVVAALEFDATTPFPGSAIAVPVLGSALVLAAGVGSVGVVGRLVLGNRILVLVGDLSFSIYLWHWPLLIIAQESHVGPLSGTTRAVLIGAAVLLSCITYYGLENPLRRSRRLKREPAFSVLNGIMIVAVVFVVLAGQTHRQQPPSQAVAAPTVTNTSTLVPLSDVRALVSSAPTITAVPPDLTPSLTNPADAGGAPCPSKIVTLGPGNYCAFGAASATRTIALLGDSHAAEWTYALAPLAARFGYRLYRFSLPGCPAPDVHMLSRQTNRPNTDCDTYHTLAQAKIKSLNPDILIVTDSAKEPLDAHGNLLSSAAWQAGTERTLRSAAGARTRSYVLGDYAYLPINGADCLAAHQSEAQACSTTRVAQNSGVMRSAEASAARAVGGTYIDTMPWVCSTKCTAVIGNFLVYKDLYHLSEAYTEYLTGAVAQALGLKI